MKQFYSLFLIFLLQDGRQTVVAEKYKHQKTQLMHIRYNTDNYRPHRSAHRGKYHSSFIVRDIRLLRLLSFQAIQKRNRSFDRTIHQSEKNRSGKKLY